MDKWRTGRKVKQNIYRQLGPEPSDSDPEIGHFCNPDDAIKAVHDHNAGELRRMRPRVLRTRRSEAAARPESKDENQQ